MKILYVDIQEFVFFNLVGIVEGEV